MERKEEKFIVEWLKNSNSNILLLYGVIGCGKTHLSIKAASSIGNYKYIELNDEIITYLKENSILNIKQKLQLNDENKILVVDGITNSDSISLFRFVEHTEYKIILLSDTYSSIETIYNYVTYKQLYFVDFPEFLFNMHREDLIVEIQNSFRKLKPIKHHQEIMKYFDLYLILGNDPKVITEYFCNQNLHLANLKKSTITPVFYKKTNLDYQKTIDILLLLQSEKYLSNKKFKYSDIIAGGRSKDYFSTIMNLASEGIVIKVDKIDDIKEFNVDNDQENFRLTLSNSSINTTYLNSLYNYIAYTLKQNNLKIYFYKNQGKAIVDFVAKNRDGEIIAFDIKTSTNSKSKVLNAIAKDYKINKNYILCNNNLTVKGNGIYLPFYALFCIGDLYGLV